MSACSVDVVQMFVKLEDHVFNNLFFLSVLLHLVMGLTVLNFSSRTLVQLNNFLLLLSLMLMLGNLPLHLNGRRNMQHG